MIALYSTVQLGRSMRRRLSARGFVVRCRQRVGAAGVAPVWEVEARDDAGALHARRIYHASLDAPGFLLARHSGLSYERTRRVLWRTFLASRFLV